MRLSFVQTKWLELPVLFNHRKYAGNRTCQWKGEFWQSQRLANTRGYYFNFVWSTFKIVHERTHTVYNFIHSYSVRSRTRTCARSRTVHEGSSKILQVLFRSIQFYTVCDTVSLTRFFLEAFRIYWFELFKQFLK